MTAVMQAAYADTGLPQTGAPRVLRLPWRAGFCVS